MTFSTRECHLFTGTIITNPKTLIMILTWISQAPQILGKMWKFIQIPIWRKLESMTFSIRGVLANPITFPHYQLVLVPQIEIALLLNFRYFQPFPLKLFSRMWCFPSNLACLWALLLLKNPSKLDQGINWINQPPAYPGWAARLFWRTSETSKSRHKSSNQKGFQRL